MKRGFAFLPGILIIAAIAGVLTYVIFQAASEENDVAVTNTVAVVHQNANTADTNATIPPSWKTVADTDLGLTLYYPETWADIATTDVAYDHETRYYPPTGENAIYDGKLKRMTSGGTSDPDFWIVAESSDYTVPGDGACSTLYPCEAPLTAASIAQLCEGTDSDSGVFANAAFLECEDVADLQTSFRIKYDVDEARYYIVADVTYPGNIYQELSFSKRLIEYVGESPTQARLDEVVAAVRSTASSTIRTTYLEFREVLDRMTLSPATADWKTYTNTTLHYSIRYPSDYRVVEDGDRTNWYKGDELIFDVNYRIDAVDGSLSYWFDTAPVADITLGSRSGKKFAFQYCDGPGCGAKTLAYVVQHQSKLLGLEFSDSVALDPTEEQILDSFQFTN